MKETKERMNKETALQLLGFYNNEDISEIELRQRYRMYALMYHPDKNEAEDASLKFLEIKEAYDVLQTYMDNKHIRLSEVREDEMTYHRILKEYLGIQIVDDKINDILDNLLSVCEKQSILILEKIEGKKFEMMYSILKKYRHVFFLSEHFYQQMELIYERKTKQHTNPEIIELYPTINDLIQHMVYKLNRNDEIYLVPLWHHELIYEDKNTGNEFIVRCIPNIGNDYWIDEQNNIHCNKIYDINYVFEKSGKKEQIEVAFGDYKSVFFNPWELKIISTPQIIRWKKEGIYIPETELELNINTKKADILLYISLQ